MRGSALLAAKPRASATSRHRHGTARRAPYAHERMPCLLLISDARNSRREFAQIDRRSLQNSFLASSRRDRLCTGELFEDCAQFAQGAMDAHFHGPNFAVEHARDLFVLEFLKAAEDEYFPLFARQHEQCFV